MNTKPASRSALCDPRIVIRFSFLFSLLLGLVTIAGTPGVVVARSELLPSGVVAPPANDTCAGAIPLTLNRPKGGTFSNVSNDYQLAPASACFPATVGQSADTADGNDLVYSFTAPSAGSYSFKVWNSSGINPVLYLANSCPAATSGTPVTVTCTHASNRGTGAEEINCISMSAGQQVFLFLDETAATNPFSFLVQVENCAAQETEANNTPPTAIPLSCGVTGTIVPGGDVDFFNIGTPLSGSRIFAMIDAAASGSTDIDLRVTTATDTLEYDDTNNDNPWGGLSPNIAGTIANGLPLFLRVNGFSASTQIDPYHLYSVVQPPIAQATSENEPNDTTATANDANNNYFSGTLSGTAPSTDKDVYAFTANAGDLIYVALDGDPSRNNTPINAKISLLDVNGALLISANDGGSGSSTTSGVGSLSSTSPSSPAEGILFRAPSSAVYFVEVAIGTASTGSAGAGDYLLSIAKNCSKGSGGRPHSSIDLFKLTNGTDNDAPPGPTVPAGSTVTFTYVVTNTGSQPLQGVTVTDDDGTPANSADDFNPTFVGGDTNHNGVLDLDETWTYTASHIATPGQYTNRGTVSGFDAFGQVVTANNPDNHFVPGPTPTPTATATATATATPTPPPGLVANVSTRLPVLTGDNVLIEGFIVQGPPASIKKIIVRAIGPSLIPFGIPDALANPTLEIRDANNILIATNNDWRNTQPGGIIVGDQSAEIQASGVAPGNDLESAIIANLTPGSYTAIVRGVEDTTGAGVVDAYDLSASAPARLANIATRGLVQPGDKLMIAGFIIQSGNVRAVVCAIGPSLSGFGISNALPDTTLELRNQNGAIVRANDDWESDQKSELQATGLQPSDPREAAAVDTIAPGQYTVQVRGKPESTGIGVVQVFFLQ